MSKKDAPLYVRAHDLACDLHRRFVDGPQPALRHRLLVESQELLCQVSLALAFIEGRAERQAAADHAVTRLKVLVRVARDVELISEGAARHVGDELVEIGRMIGGWRRRQLRPDKPAAGEGPDPARTA